MTILRKAEYQVLKSIMLHGSVVDLGGDSRSEYHSLFKGEFKVTTANLGGDTKPDVILDLEKPLPFDDGSYDGALLINVLEHIFEYRQLLGESARVLKPGGMLVIVVPFMFPYHPSPKDFHRYSGEALEKALSIAGFTDISVTPLGSGVFAVRWVLLERLLPGLLRPLSLVVNPLAKIADYLFAKSAGLLGKKYQPSDYPLGYVVTAVKPR